MNTTRTQQTEVSRENTLEPNGPVAAFHGVRYQVTDVARSVAFYTRHLGFTPGHQQLPAFAAVSLEDLNNMEALWGRHRCASGLNQRTR